MNKGHGTVPTRARSRRAQRPAFFAAALPPATASSARKPRTAPREQSPGPAGGLPGPHCGRDSLVGGPKLRAPHKIRAIGGGLTVSDATSQRFVHFKGQTGRYAEPRRPADVQPRYGCSAR